MFAKRSATFLIILSIISANFLPIFADRAEAQFVTVTSDPLLESLSAAEKVYRIAKDKADSLAMIAARLAIQQVVNSTIKWAQSGFDGNPAYVTDPKQYFSDLADNVAGKYISGSKLNYLCSPFQLQVRLALQKHYVQEQQFQCTLTGVVANIDAFYNDFNQGGWDAWYSMTQNESNNPYGAYLAAQIDLDSRIAESVGLKKDDLNLNQGFLSWKECKPENVITQKDIDMGLGQNDAGGSDYKVGDCYDDGSGNNKITVTPGSTIKAGLDKVLPSGLDSLITVNHVEQLIEAFATGLLNKYVFGSEGLFKHSSSLPTNQPGSSTGGGENVGGTITPPTYAQCVASCNAAVEQGIDAESCIAAACTQLTP